MTKSKKLVVVENFQAVTTSLIIADGTDNEHESIMRLIQKYQDKFERWGQIYFSDLKSGKKSIDTADNDKPRLLRDGRGRPTRIAYLNETQATFLITLLRNTEIVVDFKSELVDQFVRMRQKLASLSAEEIQRQKIRRAGIDGARKPFTDAIKVFVDKEQPKNPGLYYSVPTKRIQTELCGIPKGARDLASGRELLKLATLEVAGANTFNAADVQGKNFWGAYDDVDQVVSILASVFDGKTPLLH